MRVGAGGGLDPPETQIGATEDLAERPIDNHLMRATARNSFNLPSSHRVATLAIEPRMSPAAALEPLVYTWSDRDLEREITSNKHHRSNSPGPELAARRDIRR